MDTQMNRLRRTPKNRHLDFADNRKGFEEIIVVPGGTGATSRIDDYQYSPRARRRIGSDLQVSGDGSRPFEVQPTAELDDLDVTIDLERWSVNTRESELRVPVVRRLGVRRMQLNSVDTCQLSGHGFGRLSLLIGPKTVLARLSFQFSRYIREIVLPGGTGATSFRRWNLPFEAP